MTKIVTLRPRDDVYEELREAAVAKRRTLSNLIEAAALAWIHEGQYVDDEEVVEILRDYALLPRLKSGSRQARQHKGDIVYAASAGAERHERTLKHHVPEPSDSESQSC